jgi:hypothetical protein
MTDEASFYDRPLAETEGVILGNFQAENQVLAL